ncbi:MAG TPA: transcription termination factor Rho [Candidatus Saccharimonadales bacterium]|nr:transcription termination factor Rho [Candidatus Saccharimonadales bacterium]
MATKKIATQSDIVSVDDLVGKAPASDSVKIPSEKKAAGKAKKSASKKEDSTEPEKKATEEQIVEQTQELENEEAVKPETAEHEQAVQSENIAGRPASHSSQPASQVEQVEQSDESVAGRRIHIGGSDEQSSGQVSNYPQRPTNFRNDNSSGRPSNDNRFNRFTPQRDIQTGPTETVVGFLDIQPEGHGFLRPKFIPSSRDIYISQSQIRRFMLRAGDRVEGLARPPKDTERYYGLLKVEKVNEMPADESMKRPHFDDLTAIYPDRQVVLSTGKTPLSTRVIDLIAPIGFGQRGMIVSPPKAGKTTILKEIAAGISANYPEAHLMAALIGERPEEVTDISMSVKGEVVASNFDEPPDAQTRVAEITLDRAKRMVELGKDVIVLLDSITRLARAYNLVVDPSGRTLSGGFDPGALYPAKKFFGAARNAQEGGSLTIIGTALIETGSRMDDLIYEEFKGTGNMELHLVRSLAEKRVFPAIGIERSGTRGEEKILDPEKLTKIVTMRRMMDMLDSSERTERLVEQLTKAEDNDKFLDILGKT